MNNPESIKIIERFFEAVDELKSMRKIKSYQTFLDLYGIEKRSFYGSKSDYLSDRFQVVWLAYLINDYGVSPEWLFSGKGKMLR